MWLASGDRSLLEADLEQLSSPPGDLSTCVNSSKGSSWAPSTQKQSLQLSSGTGLEVLL